MVKKQCIGIIGLNSVSLDFAERLVLSGFEVLLSTTGCPMIFRDFSKFLHPKIKSVSLSEAAGCEIIILFISKEKMLEVASEIPKTSGKIVFYHNYLVDNGNVVLKNSSSNTSSEVLAGIVPTATIVDIFTPFEINTSKKESKRSVFYATNDIKVREKVEQLLIQLNFNAIWIDMPK